MTADEAGASMASNSLERGNLTKRTAVSRLGQARQVAKRSGIPLITSTMVTFADAIAAFAPLGWAMCGRWHEQGTARVVRLAADGASDDEVDEAITSMWNTEGEFLLRMAATPIRAWSNADQTFKQLLWDRVTIMEKAIAYHSAGAYDASIPILLAQIEGLSFDLTGKAFFTYTNQDSYLDDTTLAGMEANLPVVRKVFSEQVNETGWFGKVSRHGVLHGRDLGYATRTNSTKTIVLLAALAEYFPKIANDLGKQLRVKHEQSVAGTPGVDVDGRLLDDRLIPEVQQFDWDYDLAYMNSVLMPSTCFDEAQHVIEIARKVGLNPAQVEHGCDSVGVWWYLKLPADHVMGYAARPSTNPQRRHPDVWHWDQHNPPASLPWVELDGWQSDDDLPLSPNWEPKPIF